MPELDAALFGHDSKSPLELEARRREIISEISSFPKSYDDPNIPIPLLQELALVTGMLRRKNAGPPRAAKPKSGNSKSAAKSLDDLL